MAVRLICNQQVAGSTPVAGSIVNIGSQSSCVDWDSVVCNGRCNGFKAESKPAALPLCYTNSSELEEESWMPPLPGAEHGLASSATRGGVDGIEQHDTRPRAEKGLPQVKHEEASSAVNTV